MNPFSHTGLSISDSLKSVRKSVLIYETEYSRAVTPQVRQAGNRLSGLTETAYTSLLA